MSFAVASAVATGFLDTANFLQQRVAAKADKMLKQVNADASNLVRESVNERNAATNSLSEFMRTTSNKRLMEYGGQQANAISQNLGRLQDQLAVGSLSNRVKAAEQLGSVSAMAAASGVGGAAVSTIDMTLRLRNAITQQQIDDNGGYATYDMIQQRAGVIANASARGNYAQSVAALDYTQDVPTYTAIPTWTQFAANQAAKMVSNGTMKGIVNSFQADQAGPQLVGGMNATGAVGTPFGGGTFFGLNGTGGIRLGP